MKDSIIQAFFALIRAGLWGTEVQLSDYGDIDYSSVMSLAEEQSVVGLVTAGLDCVKDVNVPQEWMLQFIGSTLQIEQQNKVMNLFVARLIEKFRKEDIYAILVKGQGIAQCYEKPLWRCSGDVDLFLSDDNYEKAKKILMSMASSMEGEYVREKHLGMTIDEWVVELHGRLYSGLSSKIERELDKVYEDTFYGGAVRSWDNNGVRVFLLKAENDVFYVFAHILQHFFKEGLGIRQVCDWCRLLWTYRDSLNYGLLESRIRKAGLMSEWRAFYALATKYLGMPEASGSMFQVSGDKKWEKKADKIMDFILMSGNMGHNRDMSHFSKYPYLIRKCVSMGRRIGDLINHARIFPMDSLRFFPRLMWNGARSAMRGEG